MNSAQLDQKRLAKFEAIALEHGQHSSPSSGMCAMEAAAWIAGEEFSDHPQCVCPVIAAYMRQLNDRLSNEDRQLLKPYIVKVLNTRGDRATEIKRAWIATDTVVRKIAPTWLELAGLGGEAAALRALSSVTAETVGTVRNLLSGIRSKARSKRDENFGKLKTAAAYDAAAYDAANAANDAAANAAYAASAAADASYAAASAAADASYAASDASDAAAYAASAAAYAAYAADAADAASSADAADAASSAASSAKKKLTYDEIKKRCEEALAPTVARVRPMLFETIDAMLEVA